MLAIPLASMKVSFIGTNLLSPMIPIMGRVTLERHLMKRREESAGRILATTLMPARN